MSKHGRKQGPTNHTVIQRAPRLHKGPPPLPQAAAPLRSGAVLKGPPPLPTGPVLRKGPPPLPASSSAPPAGCPRDRGLVFDSVELEFFRRGEALSREHIRQGQALERAQRQVAEARARRRNLSRAAAGGTFAATVALALVSVGQPAWELARGFLEPPALAQVSPAPKPVAVLAHADGPRSPRAAESRPIPATQRDTRHRNRSNTASRAKKHAHLPASAAAL